VTLKIRRIAVRFALLLAVAAIVPLLAYGIVSILSLQRGTRTSVIAGNENVATRAAEELRRYVTSNAEILKALAADLQDTGLTVAQQDRVLKNYILEFREFHEITLFDEQGNSIASSRLGAPHAQIPKNTTVDVNGVAMSPIHVDADLLPTAIFAVHLTRLNQPAGWLVGEFSLEEMWRMVDRIRIGEHGYAMVVAPDGQLVAHGDPDRKALIAQMSNMAANPLVSASRASRSETPVSQEYVDADGRRELGVAARIPSLGWTVIVEQPTSEAYAAATQLQRQLAAAILAALFVMIGFGYLFGRSFITPILALKRATGALAQGQLDTRVHIETGDEFGDLGDSFNTMAVQLTELQENVKRQERQAMFGRVAAGLVHDLLHPIQNVGNNVALLRRTDLDDETRADTARVIDREMSNIKRFLEDLRNLVKPKPLERLLIDANVTVGEVYESMRAEGERHGIQVESRCARERLPIEGDPFALGRVIRNLITNGIQATASGGNVTVATMRSADRVEIRVADTGSGIPADRLATIFDEFVTTKRRGLGLGLAVSKRIVEQLGGTIDVESEVGRGTAFTLRFPARDDRTAQVAAS
jgi:signal transduction histidine kinase